MGKVEAKQIVRQLKSYQQQVTASPKAALQALQKAGLVTKQGNPTKPYRQTQQRRAKG